MSVDFTFMAHLRGNRGVLKGGRSLDTAVLLVSILFIFSDVLSLKSAPASSPMTTRKQLEMGSQRKVTHVRLLMCQSIVPFVHLGKYL